LDAVTVVDNGGVWCHAVGGTSSAEFTGSALGRGVVLER